MGATLSILGIVALPAPSNAMFAKGGTYWFLPYRRPLGACEPILGPEYAPRPVLGWR